MFKGVEISRATKTKGIAVTYRAGPNKYDTCPNTCKLKPVGEAGTNKIDREYEKAIRDNVPRSGYSWLYTHFPPSKWSYIYRKGKAVFNFSADNLRQVKASLKKNAPTVLVVGSNFWSRSSNSKRHYFEGVGLGVRCPAEYNKKLNCQNCGSGRPLCARPERNYFILFTDHSAKKDFSCYAGQKRVNLHWSRLASFAGLKSVFSSDAVQLKNFVKSLPPRSLLRHHVAGDIGG
jgi:hypothetical protein